MSQRKSRPPQKSGKSFQNNKGQPPNRLPLADNTVNAFLDLGAISDNVGLLFDRYVRFVGPGWSIEAYKVPGRKPGKMETKNAKQWNLQQIVEAQTHLKERWQQGIFAAAVERWQAMVGGESEQTRSFKLTPEWRFVVGLGDKTALEVGFTFHRIYGFPIIPGSALKGLARAAALSEIADRLHVPRLSLSQTKERGDKEKTPLEKLEIFLLANDKRIRDVAQAQKAKKEEKEAWQKLHQDQAVKQLELTPEDSDKIHIFRQIFGSQHAAGQAIFFDAVPAEPPELELDVMNVHYPDYYGVKGELPTDNQNPNPIPFLTIGRSPFWFAVGWRGEIDKEGLSHAKKWLKAGLNEFGIGAKTAAGYGYFEVE